jgi:hypothetical protein
VHKPPRANLERPLDTACRVEKPALVGRLVVTARR